MASDTNANVRTAKAPRLALLALGVAGLAIPGGRAAAQHVPPVRMPEVEARAIPLPYHDPERTLRLVAARRAEAPAAIDLHLIVAREATTLGVVHEDADARLAWLAEAERAARAAVALDSTHVEASYWLAAALGLRADQEGGRAKITLARESYTRAQRTLELDSLHAGANHIVGRLHSGAKRLGWVSRMIARGLGLGDILDEASWESAERHMRVAYERDPGQLVHHFELGKLLVEHTGDTVGGVAILRDLAAREPRHVLDLHYSTLASWLLAGAGTEASCDPPS